MSHGDWTHQDNEGREIELCVDQTHPLGLHRHPTNGLSVDAPAVRYAPPDEPREPIAPVCQACDLDMHTCPGCGASLEHGQYACTDCLADPTLARRRKLPHEFPGERATRTAPVDQPLPPWPNGQEQETDVELIVKLRHFGKPDQRTKLAYSVARTLNTAVSDSARVYFEGKLIPFDKVLDDGHAPPGYVPSDPEVAKAYEPITSRIVQGPVWAGEEQPRP